MENIFGLLLVGQIFTDLTNSKQKYADFCTIFLTTRFRGLGTFIATIKLNDVVQFSDLCPDANFQVISFSNLEVIHDFPIC